MRHFVSFSLSRLGKQSELIMLINSPSHWDWPQYYYIVENNDDCVLLIIIVVHLCTHFCWLESVPYLTYLLTPVVLSLASPAHLFLACLRVEKAWSRKYYTAELPCACSMWEKNVSNLWRTFTIFLFLVLPPTLVGKPPPFKSDLRKWLVNKLFVISTNE